MKFRSDVVLFIAESWKRWGEKSPKYFRTVKAVNIVISSLGGLPLLLSSLGVITTGITAKIIMVAAAFGGAWAAANNALAVSKPDPNVMPFTEKKQIQEDIKKEEIINKTLR